MCCSRCKGRVLASPENAKGKTRQKKKATAPLDDPLKARLSDLREKGFNRLYQNGQIFEFSTPESLLDINFAEPVFLLVDRIVVSAEIRARLVDAIESSYRQAGEVIFETVAARWWKCLTTPFSQRFECKLCNLRYEEPEPRLFLLQ